MSRGEPYQHYIDGEFQSGHGDETFESIDPATAIMNSGKSSPESPAKR